MKSLKLMVLLFITGCFFSVSVFADLRSGSEGFEEGWGDWGADNGVWEIGKPTVGPDICHIGTNCAGTVLNGNYPDNTCSRLITPSFRLSSISGDEEIQLRFWHWFSYCNAEGWIQISVYDEALQEWSDWTTIGNSVNSSSPTWSLRNVDLTAYAGEKVRIAFYHTEISYNSYYYCASSGWYIDDIEITGISSEGCSQEQLNAERATGRQECMDEPASCGISTDGGYTQADLDAKYQEGYNAGCTGCSNGNVLPATISPELKMNIPVLQYVSPFGAMDLWANFEFVGESNGDMLWKLSDFGQK